MSGLAVSDSEGHGAKLYHNSEFVSGCQSRYAQEGYTCKLVEFVRLYLPVSKVPPPGIIAGMLNWALQQIDDMDCSVSEVEAKTAQEFWNAQNESQSDFNTALLNDRRREFINEEGEGALPLPQSLVAGSVAREKMADTVLQTMILQRLCAIDRVAELCGDLIPIAGSRWYCKVFETVYSNDALVDLYQKDAGFERFDPDKYWDTLYSKAACESSPAYYWHNSTELDADRLTAQGRIAAAGPLYKCARGYARFKNVLDAHVHLPSALLTLFNGESNPAAKRDKLSARIQRVRAKFLDLIVGRIMARDYFLALENSFFASVLIKLRRASHIDQGERQSLRREAKLTHLTSHQNLSINLRRLLSRLAEGLLYPQLLLQAQSMLLLHQLTDFIHEKAPSFLCTILGHFSKSFKQSLNRLSDRLLQQSTLISVLNISQLTSLQTSSYLSQIVAEAHASLVWFPIDTHIPKVKSTTLGLINSEYLNNFLLAKCADREVMEDTGFLVNAVVLHLLLLKAVSQLLHSEIKSPDERSAKLLKSNLATRLALVRKSHRTLLSYPMFSNLLLALERFVKTL